MVLVGIVLSFDWCVIANADEKLTIDRTLAENRLLLVTDGAFHLLDHSELSVDVLLGDFDSIDDHIFS